jgi:hypothetical protein
MRKGRSGRGLHQLLQSFRLFECKVSLTDVCTCDLRRQTRGDRQCTLRDLRGCARSVEARVDVGDCHVLSAINRVTTIHKGFSEGASEPHPNIFFRAQAESETTWGSERWWSVEDLEETEIARTVSSIHPLSRSPLPPPPPSVFESRAQGVARRGWQWVHLMCVHASEGGGQPTNFTTPLKRSAFRTTECVSPWPPLPSRLIKT